MKYSKLIILNIKNIITKRIFRDINILRMNTMNTKMNTIIIEN